MTITTRGKKGWEGDITVMVKKGTEVVNEVTVKLEVGKEAEEKLSLDIQLPQESHECDCSESYHSSG